jgi:hypothetical protein
MDTCGQKICSKCFTLKPYTEYYKESKTKNGYRSSCKICQKLIKHLHYINNKEKYKEAYDNFLERNPDYFLNYRNRVY